MLLSTCGILPSSDFDETAEFYGKIGFEEKGRWTGNGYLIISMENVEIHFFEHKTQDPATNYHAIYIRSDDIDGLSDHIATLGLPSEGLPRFHPAEDKSWQMREIALLDPNGNLLRIGQFM